MAKIYQRCLCLLLIGCVLLSITACNPTHPGNESTSDDSPLPPSEQENDAEESIASQNPYADIDINSLPDAPQDKIPATECGYFASGETVTQYTGEERKIRLDDLTYGGAQYVTKLFTEGLGRGPEANEYLYYMQQIEENGCNAETLSAITEQFFSAKAFLSLKLDPAYEVMAVYRAVLNRDPTPAEAQDYAARVTQEKAVGIALSLLQTDEFAALLPGILQGAYYWGTNSTEYSPGGVVLTGGQFKNKISQAGSSGILELEPGTLVLLGGGVTIPEGMTVTTRGNPTHYTQQARILRTKNNTERMVSLQKNAVLSHVWVDGNRLAFEEEGFAAGGNATANIALIGDGASCHHCKTNGTMGGTTIFGADLVRDLHIANNLVTAYETKHFESKWADGITVASTNCIIENNTVIDATDVGIILFRYISNGYTEPQNSVVRNNSILNVGNSAYAAIDIDAWNNQNATQNFTGTLFENNAIWTSFRAHYHICLSLATLAWHNVIGDDAIGSTLINNYTPEGLQVLCSVIFAADGCHDFIARGNHINAYISSAWALGNENQLLRERLSSINPDTASGDLQGDYEKLTTWLPYLPIIQGHSTEPLYHGLTVKGAIFHEDRVTATEVGHPTYQ